MHFIRIRGARTHNLRNIDLELPRDRLIVLTGLSGSGKSSLAFDTIYAEGQRRYVESLSAYARQFLERIQKPDVDAVDGICPAVAIRQRTSTRNPRSTVATATEIHDHLRLLFARLGRTECDSCGATVTRDSPESVAERLLAMPQGCRVVVCFPVVPGGTPLPDLLERLRRRGFGRLLLEGEVRGLESLDGAGDAPDPEGGRHLGDLLISVPQAARQAGERRHSLARELRVLVLHGYLHLLGHDHETDGGRMMRLQRRLERRLLPGPR